MYSPKMRNRSIALLLLAVCALSTACGSADTPDETQAETSAKAETTAAVTEAEKTRFDELGAKDFGGEKFVILDANDHPDIHINMPGEDMNGDLVNDKLIERDTFIEDTYNVDIEYIQLVNAKNGVDKLANSVLANDKAYSLCISTLLGGTLGAHATDGVLMNLCDLKNLSLDQKWWSSLMYDSLRLNDAMYYTTGDISPTMYQMAGATYINKKLLSDYDIDIDLFQLVRDGKWTLDQLIEITKDKEQDINADGVMNVDDDIFGFVNQPVENSLTSNLYLISSGVELSSITEDGSGLICNVGDEKSIAVIDKFSRLINPKLKMQDQNDPMKKAFKEDRALALMHYTETAAVFLRDMESDYVILPLPKFDEAQETYRSFVNAWADAFIGIPKTADPEFTGFITEAMAFYSYDRIRPFAFEMTYKQKALRDEESAEMLDVIFDNIYLDFNCIYNFGGISDKMTRVFGGHGEIASIMAEIQPKIEADIEKFVEAWNNQ